MAKKTQEGLLGEIIVLLRKQNQLSTRDRLKEAEEVKRQEAIDEERDTVTIGRDGNIIDAKEDFARRYKANIAGKITQTRMDASKTKQKKKTQGVIAHATFMTRRLMEKSNKMSYMWRIKSMQNRIRREKQENMQFDEGVRNREEDRREGKKSGIGIRGLLTKYLGGRGLRKARILEERQVIKENWKYMMLPLAAALAAIGLASEGIHRYHARALKMMVKAEDWAKMTAKLETFKLNMETDWKSLTTMVDNFRIKTLKWFGYGPDGKPLGMRGSVTFLDDAAKNKASGPINFGLLQKIVADRIYAMKVKAYNSVGLGPDGKKLGNTFRSGPNPQGTGPRSTYSTGTSTALSRITQPFINKVRGMITLMFKPFGVLSNVMTNWKVTKEGKSTSKFLKLFKKGGSAGLTILKRILWPLTAVFTVWESFKAGKTEMEREGSNWFTILGEAVGGGIGFFFGAFADLIKDGVVWIIKKMFGYESNEDGTIKEGQGLGGEALRMIQGFSIQDALHTLIAAPYHLISNIVKFIGAIFEGDGSYKDTALWGWFSEIGTKVANWFKGFIPEKIRKYFGIELDSDDTPIPNASDALVKSIMIGQATQSGIYKGGELNALTGKHWTREDVQRMQKAYGDDWTTNLNAIHDYNAAATQLNRQQGENVRGATMPNIVNYNGVTYSYRATVSGWSEYLQEVIVDTAN